MKVLDFDSYNEIEKELKKQFNLLLNMVREYIEINDNFRNKYRLYDVIRVNDLFYDSLRDNYELSVSFNGISYTSKIINKKEYDDINYFLRDTEKYKLEKTANKFNI